MLRFLVWLLSALWLATPGVLVSAPAATSAPAPLAAPRAAASDDSLSGLLPEGALACVHVPSGLAVWDCPAGRSARALAEESGLVRELAPLRGALRLATGADPESLLRFLLGGEVAVALYAGPPSRLAAGESGPRAVVALSRTEDAEGLQRTLGALLALASNEHDVRHLLHKDLPYARVDRKLFVAAHEGVLIAGNNDELLTEALERVRQAATAATVGARASPAAANVPSSVKEPPTGSATLATFSFDTALLQASTLRGVRQPGRKLLGRRLANPLANLLFGGLTLAEGRVDGALTSNDNSLTLQALLPPPPADAAAAWFPPGVDSMVVPTTPQTIAVVSARRDLADWWRQREVLMSEDSQPALAKADENIAVLFAGLSPAEDVFAAVAPELALVVDRQLFADASLVPEVRLPGFCLVGRLVAASEFSDSVSVAFQSMVSIVNMDRARDGRAPFVLEVEEHEGVPMRLARLAPRRTDGPAALGTDPNWSPAAAIVDDWLLIGSSAEQVRRLISSIHGGAPVERDGTFGFDIDMPTAIELARENRAGFVAQRMLEDGADPDEAGSDIDKLLQLLSVLTKLRADVRQIEDGLQLELTLGFAPPATLRTAEGDR